MPTYIVNMKEIWVQPVRIEANSPDEAFAKVCNGGGEYIEFGFEYVEALDDNYSTWEVEEE